MEEQSAFLKVAKEYKDMGLIDKIHMSTRPDYIDRDIPVSYTHLVMVTYRKEKTFFL